MPSAIAKKLNRLSRDKLVQLCVSWSKSSKCSPYLASNRNNVEVEEEDYLHEPAHSRGELKGIYHDFTDCDSDLYKLSKKDIVDRIVDGDWRRGITHQQLAEIDFATLEENESSMRWTAVKLVPLAENDNKDVHPAKKRKINHEQRPAASHYPSKSVAAFVRDLKKHISPLVKAHYHIHRLTALRLSIIRLYMQPDAPFAPLSTNVPRQNRSAVDASRTIYIVLPDSCPYVYLSVAGAASDKVVEKSKQVKPVPKVDIAAAKRVVLEAIPKALSRPQQRWSIEGTKLTARSLKTMVLLRGGGTVGTTGGVTSQLAPNGSTKKRKAEELENDEDRVNGEDSSEREQRERVERMFGNNDSAHHAKLDKVQLHIRDLLTSPSSAKRRRKSFHDARSDVPAPITVTLSGNNVFNGLKEFAQRYPQYVDLSKMPSALTGASGTTQMTI